MPGHSEEIQHWQGLLTQYRQNARTLCKQLAVYGAGAEPLHLRNQLDATEDEIRKAKTALRKLGESPELLPGDPDDSELDEAAPPIPPLEPSLAMPPSPGPLPELNAPPDIHLIEQEKLLIQSVHRGYKQVIIEKEFEGGYSGTRVFLVLPVRLDGSSDARLVTKIGPAEALRREQDNYQNIVGRALPFTAAQVRDYTQKDGQAALNYVFVGGETLGRAASLEEYYRTSPTDAVTQTLQGLLDQALAPRWYRQSQALNRPFRNEYGRHLPPHEELERITAAIFPRLSPLADNRIKIPGVPGEYPHPLKVYPRIGDQTLEGHRSFVHGDLHLRNILVDQTGKGWLIDFAKVTQRHNLFDFIKLETYIRLTALAAVQGSFSWSEYLSFEQALLDPASAPPANDDLQSAYRIIVSIREIAERCVSDPRNFHKEYLPALFLYCLAMMKYYPSNGAAPTQLMFLTACVLGQSILGLEEQTCALATDRLSDVLTIYPEYPDGRPEDLGGQKWMHLVVKSKKPVNECAGWIHDIQPVPSRFQRSILSWAPGKFTPLPFKAGESKKIDLVWHSVGGPEFGDELRIASAQDQCRGKRNSEYTDECQDFISLKMGTWFLTVLFRAKGYNDVVKRTYQLHWQGLRKQQGFRLVEVDGEQLNGANKSPGSQPGPGKSSTWNSVAIRDLLIAAFDDEELTTLCFDHFRPVYEEFSNGMSKRQKAQRLLDYCVRRSQLEKLLSLIKKHNPSQYALFAPKLHKS